MTPARVTLRTIAEKTGVTRMAVSLALRGKEGVSPETRERVVRAARELGHQPDPEVAKLLSHIRRRPPTESGACLALLTSGATPGAWKHYATERKYVEGATTRAREHGYRLEEFWIRQPGMSLERLGNILWSRGIEGVVIAPLQGDLPGGAPRTIALDFNRFAAVEISETVDFPDLDRSLHDQYTSMLKVLEKLGGLGYRSVGLVLEEALDARVNGKWTAAFLYHRHRTGSHTAPPPLILPKADQRAFDRWFDKHRPDALVSVNRFGLRLAKGKGLRIPRDTAYASLDLDGEAAGGITPSGIDQNSRLVGAAAVDMLLAAIHAGSPGSSRHGPLRTEIQGSWIRGKTTPLRKGPRGRETR